MKNPLVIPLSTRSVDPDPSRSCSAFLLPLICTETEVTLLTLTCFNFGCCCSHCWRAARFSPWLHTVIPPSPTRPGVSTRSLPRAPALVRLTSPPCGSEPAELESCLWKKLHAEKRCSREDASLHRDYGRRRRRRTA